MTDVNEHKRL